MLGQKLCKIDLNKLCKQEEEKTKLLSKWRIRWKCQPMTAFET
jgi:hypothetical protein